jgi:outer membrane receptor for ferric coprogen and ferric-rhodotorulic acid
VRKYRVNLVSSYDFSHGRLRGFGVGGAARWQSKVATGYATTLNADNRQVPILDRVFWGPEEFNGDLWLSYKRKVSERIRWKAQLNLRNIIGSQDDILVASNPDGRPAVFRIAPERQWFLTNTFSF